MALFSKSEIVLVDAKVYFKYVGGGYDLKELNIQYSAPAGTSASKDRLKEFALKKVTPAYKKHEIRMTVTGTDPRTGQTNSAAVTYLPKHEEYKAPTKYKAAEKKSIDIDKIGKGAGKAFAALNKGLDALMAPPKKTPAKRKTAAGKPPARKPAGMSEEEYDNWYEAYYTWKSLNPPAKKKSSKKRVVKKTTKKTPAKKTAAKKAPAKRKPKSTAKKTRRR